MVLKQAVKKNVPESEMPTTIIILSDMEFNSACRRGNTALDSIKEKYEESGYTIPKIVFWNLQSRREGNFPVQITDNGTALISGFSPSILKSVLTGEEMSPISIMNKTINSERYECIKI